MKGQRPAFVTVVPRDCGDAGLLQDALWQQFHDRAATKGFEEAWGLSLDPATGNRVSASHWRKIISSMLEPVMGEQAGMWAVNSARRCQSTLCDVRRAPWHERMAAGGWRSPAGSTAEVSRESKMPTRYSGRREEQEAFVKIYHAQLMKQAAEQGCRTWGEWRVWYERSDHRELALQIATWLDSAQDGAVRSLLPFTQCVRVMQRRVQVGDELQKAVEQQPKKRRRNHRS